MMPGTLLLWRLVGALGAGDTELAALGVGALLAGAFDITAGMLTADDAVDVHGRDEPSTM